MYKAGWQSFPHFICLSLYQLHVMPLTWQLTPVVCLQDNFCATSVTLTVITIHSYLRFEFLWFLEFQWTLLVIHRRNRSQVSTLFWFNTRDFWWTNPLYFKVRLKSIITNYLIIIWIRTNPVLSYERNAALKTVWTHSTYRHYPENYNTIPNHKIILRYRKHAWYVAQIIVYKDCKHGQRSFDVSNEYNNDAWGTLFFILTVQHIYEWHIS